MNDGGNTDVEYGVGRISTCLQLFLLLLLHPSMSSAVDRLYFSDNNNHLYCLTLDGTSTAIPILTSPGGDAKDIEVDPPGGKLYWGAIDGVRRANVDGGSEEILFPPTVPGEATRGVALDASAGRIYWTTLQGCCEFGIGRIYRGNLDGTAAEELYETAPGTGQPLDIAIDESAGKVYWTDRQSEEIRRSNLDGTALEVVLSNLNDPEGIALDVAAGKVYWSEFSGPWRANLDGSSAEMLFTGGSVGDLTLDTGAGWLYVSEFMAGRIERSAQDGSNRQDVFLDESASVQPTALDVAEFSSPCPTGCAVGASGCRSAQKSLLLIKDDPLDDAKDKVIWKWIKGEATTQQDFGDPVSTTDYTLCIYAGTTAMIVSEAAIPAGGTNWSPVGTRGYSFKDSGGVAAGIQKIVLKGGTANKAKVLVKGKGGGVPDPSLSNLVLPVTVRLKNDDTAACFEAVYDASEVIKSESQVFKAKGQ